MHFRLPGGGEPKKELVGAKLNKNILGDLNKREYSFYLFIHSRSDSKTGYLVELVA